MTAAVVIPLKGFAAAKGRLAEVLDPPEREALARRLASGVISAAPGRVIVVTSDAAAARLATDLGASIVDDPGGGLNLAADAGRQHAIVTGADRVAVVHADLPFPATLAEVLASEGIVLIPDRRGDGTNVIVLPGESDDFTFSYGPGSFARHLTEAHRVSDRIHVIGDSPLGWDIDIPEDLDTPAEWGNWAACRS